MTNTSRIAKNTLMLYFRQILILLVSLYTVRAVLEALGAQDYGIYNVVAGVVTMFGFLSGAMATASQRYFSYELGRGDTAALEKMFGVTLGIYVLLIAVIFVLSQTVGLWFVLEKLVIPAQRKTAAVWVYEFAVVSFAVTLITAPYMAAIIAHEDMGVYARVSIVEAALKLSAVFALQVIPCDRLAAYGGLLLAAALINTALYRAHCRRHYAECRFRLRWDRALFRDMCGFTGWSLFGAFTTTARTQAVTVLVNQYFSPVIAASRAIAAQVCSALNIFCSNFNTSLYAPVVKEYAAGNKEGMYSLIYGGCRITFFLLYVFALPLCLRMEYVLTLWLGELPESVVVFTQLSVVEALITSVGLPLMTAARADGRVRVYELTLGLMQLCMFIGCFVWLEFFNGRAESVFIAAIILVAAMFGVRLVLVHALTGLPLGKFCARVCIPVLVIAAGSALPVCTVDRFFGQDFGGLCAVCALSFMLCGALMLAFGLDRHMRARIMCAIRRKIHA